MAVSFLQRTCARRCRGFVARPGPPGKPHGRRGAPPASARLRLRGARICSAGHRTGRSPQPDDHARHRRAARRHQPLGRHREQDGRQRGRRPDDGDGRGGFPRGRAGHGDDSGPRRLRRPSGGARALGRRRGGHSGALPSRHGAPGRDAGRQPSAHRGRQGLRTRHLRHEGRCVDRPVGDPLPFRCGRGDAAAGPLPVGVRGGGRLAHVATPYRRGGGAGRNMCW